jgi:4-amino-4-deoxy-L-arabinose transferase-like glycosyltransferase
MKTDVMRRAEPWLGWLGAFLVFIWGLSVLPGLGVGWDEHVHATYGEMVLKTFQTGGADQRNETYKDLMFYGPWVDTLAAALYGGEGHRDYHTRHLVALVFMALTLPAVYAMGRAAGGWPAGLAAMLAMALMPRYLGQGLFNTKDIPFACLFAWSLAWVWAGRGTTWRLDARGALGLGVLAGACMGIRVGGLLIFIVLGAAAGIAWARAFLSAARWPRGTAPALGWWAAAFAIAYLLMVACWPWSWHHPLSRPLEAMQRFSTFHHESWLAFEGKIVFSQRLPLDYLPAHLLLGTPLPWLALAALGLGASLVPRPGRRGVVQLGTWVWLVLPLVYVLLTRPTMYGAGRQFFFITPVLAVAAGLGFRVLWESFPRRPAWLLAGLGLCTAFAGWETFRLHPYEHTYYNAFAGPRATLPARFETDDWALSCREAAQWLNQRQAERPGRSLRVLVGANEYGMPCLRAFLNPRTQTREHLLPVFDAYDIAAENRVLPESVDYFVTLSDPGGMLVFRDMPIVHEVKSAGAVLCVIRGHE